jgi:hypothetical protein
MATATSATLEPAMLESVESVLDKQFEERRKVGKLFGTTDKAINTLGLRVSMYIRPNPSFNWFPEGGGYATPGKQTYLPTKVYPVRCSQGFEFTRTFFREIGDPNDLLRDLTNYLAQQQSTALKVFEQSVCATQTGELGVVLTRDSATQTTMTITVAGGSMFSNRKIQPGARVAWYSSAGVQRTGTNTLSVASETTPPVPSTGVTTWDLVPTDVVATDVAVYGDPTTAGSYNKALTGLQDLVASTGIIQGQDRAVYPQLKSLVTDAGAAALTQVLLRKHRSALLFRVEEEGKGFTIVSSVAQYDMLRRQAMNLIRFPNAGGKAKLDMDADFDDMPWVMSTDVHDDRLYFLFPEYFKFAYLKQWGKYNEDGKDWRLFFSNGTASDKFTGWIGMEGQLYATKLNCHVLLKNLAVPTDAALGYLTVL